MECPYEKREDNGGKLIQKDKAKSLLNKSNITKKTPPKGLVAQEEYNEDDDEDSESVAMASVAIATTPRVSLFDSPNENITAKCLMAKATNKVFASGGGSWLLDSGATNHMTRSKDLVVDVQKIPSMPTVGVKTGGSRVGGPELCV